MLELLLREFVMRICCFKLTEKLLLSLSWFISSLWCCWRWGPITLPSAPPGFSSLHIALFHILFNGALSLQLYTAVLLSYWCLKLGCAIGFWWRNLPWQHGSIVKFSLLFVNFLYITHTRCARAIIIWEIMQLLVYDLYDNGICSNIWHFHVTDLGSKTIWC